MQQQIRFCKTADGARLAYASVGSGPPLVKAANWLSHIEYDWRTPIWRPLFERLARNRRLIRYDERGCGLSDWDVEDFSLEAWVQDLETVVDAAGPWESPVIAPVIPSEARNPCSRCRGASLSAGTPRIPHLPAGGGHPARNDGDVSSTRGAAIRL